MFDGRWYMYYSCLALATPCVLRCFAAVRAACRPGVEGLSGESAEHTIGGGGSGRREGLPSDVQLEVFYMVYPGLFIWRADDGDDVKTPGLVDFPIVDIMVDGLCDVALFFPVDGLNRTDDFIRATCLYLDEHRPLVVLCYDVYVTMTGVPVAFEDGIPLFA